VSNRFTFSGLKQGKNCSRIILLRGGPNSGKTEVGHLVGGQLGKTVSIPVNTFHRFINKNSGIDKVLTFKAVINLSAFFLERGYSILVEDIFIFKPGIDLFFNLGQAINIPVYLFELKVPFEVAWHRNRDWRPPLNEDRTRKLFELIKENPDPRAMGVDAEKLSALECANTILSLLN